MQTGVLIAIIAMIKASNSHIHGNVSNVKPTLQLKIILTKKTNNVIIV